MEKITTVGIDLAKNVFSVHGVDGNGCVVLQRTVTRAKLVELVASLPPCLIGMEASMGAHEWARRFAQFGHTARLMVSKFVAPYRKGGKDRVTMLPASVIGPLKQHLLSVRALHERDVASGRGVASPLDGLEVRS